MIYFLMLLGFFLLFLGIPISIIVSIVFKVKKKKILIPVVCIPASLVLGLIFIIIGAILYGQTDEYTESVAQKEQSELEQLKEESKEQKKYIKELEERLESVEKEKSEELLMENSIVEEDNKEEIPRPTIEPTETSVATIDEIKSVFYGEIGLNEGQYKGKEASFSFRCENYTDESIKKITTKSNLCYGSISVEFLEPQDIADGSYITVRGILEEDHSANVLKSARIVDIGEKAEKNYYKEYEEWKNSFLQAEEVSYNDLLRYPDTYKNKKLKVNVNIKEVETDGVVFHGTISAVVSGTENEIAFYDYRENREPRIQEGDKLTVYGVGNGTTTVKLKKGKGIFAETVDEYDIPCIYIQFFDFR